MQPSTILDIYHRCSTNGCGQVLVLDGNMKNCRTVCACKDVNEMVFPSFGGSVATGCQNTPGKHSRFCSEHDGMARPFVDDEKIMEGKDDLGKIKGSEELLVVKLLSTRTTRFGSFYEVMWSNGRVTWVRKENLPKQITELKEGESVFSLVNTEDFGQAQKKFVKTSSKICADNGVKSSGAAIVNEEDSMIEENGVKRKLNCGTEKDKQKAKNLKTAGILVFQRPCSVVIDVKELYNSESKTQVYGHLHGLFQSDAMSSTDVICYDDACHLKKYATNAVRADINATSKKIANMDIVCDRFHFKNHVDQWCKRNCNPYSCEQLKDVNTEICEQTFSWLSKYKHMTKHMNRWRFLFLMLYILNKHNHIVQKKV